MHVERKADRPWLALAAQPVALAVEPVRVGMVSQAGAVSVLQGSGAGLASTGGRLFTQNSPGVPGTAETFDLFGGLEIVF